MDKTAQLKENLFYTTRFLIDIYITSPPTETDIADLLGDAIRSHWLSEEAAKQYVDKAVVLINKHLDSTVAEAFFQMHNINPNTEAFQRFQESRGPALMKELATYIKETRPSDIKAHLNDKTTPAFRQYTEAAIESTIKQSVPKTADPNAPPVEHYEFKNAVNLDPYTEFKGELLTASGWHPFSLKVKNDPFEEHEVDMLSVNESLMLTENTENSGGLLYDKLHFILDNLNLSQEPHQAIDVHPYTVMDLVVNSLFCRSFWYQTDGKLRNLRQIYMNLVAILYNAHTLSPIFADADFKPSDFELVANCRTGGCSTETLLKLSKLDIVFFFIRHELVSAEINRWVVKNKEIYLVDQPVDQKETTVTPLKKQTRLPEPRGHTRPGLGARRPPSVRVAGSVREPSPHPPQ
jgi:hypothetical protein